MNTQEWLELVQTVGVPSIVAGAAFYFIRYMYDSAAQERSAYLEADSESDKMILELAQNSITAINTMSAAMELHTKSIDQLLNEIRRTVGR